MSTVTPWVAWCLVVHVKAAALAFLGDRRCWGNDPEDAFVLHTLCCLSSEKIIECWDGEDYSADACCGPQRQIESPLQQIVLNRVKSFSAFIELRAKAAKPVARPVADPKAAQINTDPGQASALAGVSAAAYEEFVSTARLLSRALHSMPDRWQDLVKVRAAVFDVVMEACDTIPKSLGCIPQGGTLLAMLRYGALDGRLGRGYVDIVDGDFDLYLLLPGRLFRSTFFYQVMQLMAATLEYRSNVDLATWRPGLWVSANKTVARVYDRPGAWRCRIAEYEDLFYVECVALCRKPVMRPAGYPLYKRRSFDRFCALVHIFPLRVLGAEKGVEEQRFDSAVQRSFRSKPIKAQPICEGQVPGSPDHQCFDYNDMLPPRRCAWTPGKTMQCPNDVGGLVFHTMTSRIFSSNGIWDCVALPIKNFSKPYDLEILHTGAAGQLGFPVLPHSLLMSLAAHMLDTDSRGAPSFLQHFLSDVCQYYIRLWSSQERQRISFELRERVYGHRSGVVKIALVFLPSHMQQIVIARRTSASEQESAGAGSD